MEEAKEDAKGFATDSFLQHSLPFCNGVRIFEEDSDAGAGGGSEFLAVGGLVGD